MTKPQRVGFWFDETRGVKGEIVPMEQIVIGADYHVAHYATSVFEGIRAYSSVRQNGGGRLIFRLTDHVNRLFRSAELCRIAPIPIGFDWVTSACIEVLSRNRGDNYIRPLVYRGEGLRVNPSASPVCIFVITQDWGPYLQPDHNDGISVVIGGYRRPERDQMPVTAKTAGNYIAGGIAKIEATEAGVAEALFRAPSGRFISEGTGQNLFIVRDGVLITPNDASSRLGGITMQTVLALAKECGYRAVEQAIPIEGLFEADEVFLCGTASEINAVTSIDGHEIGRPRPGWMGPITAEIKSLYSRLVRGELPTLLNSDWLTFVPDHADVAVPEAAAS